MALYQCPECHGSVSTEAEVCPHCGRATHRELGAGSGGPSSGPAHINMRFPVLTTLALIIKIVGWLTVTFGVLYIIGAVLIEPNQSGHRYGSEDYMQLAGGLCVGLFGLAQVALAEIVGVLFAIEHNTATATGHLNNIAAAMIRSSACTQGAATAPSTSPGSVGTVLIWAGGDRAGLSREKVRLICPSRRGGCLLVRQAGRPGRRPQQGRSAHLRTEQGLHGEDLDSREGRTPRCVDDVLPRFGGLGQHGACRRT